MRKNNNQNCLFNQNDFVSTKCDPYQTITQTKVKICCHQQTLECRIVWQSNDAGQYNAQLLSLSNLCNTICEQHLLPFKWFASTQYTDSIVNRHGHVSKCITALSSVASTLKCLLRIYFLGISIYCLLIQQHQQTQHQRLS